MSESKKRGLGLGRGLSALMGDDPDEAAPSAPSRVLPVSQLVPGRQQPRRRFDEDALTQLTDSVREKGVLTPLLVRAIGPDRYEIVAGERRWRAAQRAQLHEVPVVVRELDDRTALEIALIENIQRADLDPVEEAQGYARLIEEFSHTQEELAKALGKSRSHIANMLRLLTLPAGVLALVSDGKLSAGHARALVGAPDPEALAADAVARGLSVRDMEKIAGQEKDAAAGARPARAAKRKGPDKDPDTLDLERSLTMALGLGVSIELEGQGGRLVIRYDSADQLDDVIRRLG